MKLPCWLGVCMGLCTLMLVAPVTTAAFTIFECRQVLVPGMRILLGERSPGVQEQTRFDIAPLSGGLPMPDGTINMGDDLILQQLVTGAISF